MATNTDQSPQEIDLLELFQRMGTGIKNLFLGLVKLILFLIVFGVRKVHFLALFAIAGALIGLLLFSSSKRYFSSYMVAQANGITSADMINYINDLHALCEKNNTEALAFDLQMHDTVAVKIKDIQAFFIIDLNKDDIGDFVDFKNTYNPRDTNQVRLEDRFHVSVEVFDNSAFDDVREGLFSYMSMNPYIIKLNEIRKHELSELISQTEYEIVKLDSLQNTDYFNVNRNTPVQQSQMMFLAEKEPTMYYLDKISLTRQKQYYQKELELATDAFTVIKDFTSLAVAENPRGSYLLRYGFLFGIIGFLMLLIIRFKHRISNIIES